MSTDKIKHTEKDDSELFLHIEKQYLVFHSNSQNFITGSNPPYHRHDAYEIFMFLHGNARLYIEQTCYQLEPGDIAIINPEELHRSIVLDHSSYDRIIINIKKPLFDRLSSAATNLLNCFYSHPKGKNNLIHLNKYRQDEYITLAHKLIEINHQNTYGSDLLSCCYLTELLILINVLFEHSTPRNKDNLMPELVGNIMSYINKYSNQSISLDMLSSEFNFNGNYLSALFKQHTGLTLRSYILDQRIELSKKHLRAGKNVSEACLLAGFNDYANFIRSFTKITGISPGRYANINRKIPPK